MAIDLKEFIGKPVRIQYIAIAAMALVTTGCTTQQLYNTGQSWQRTECQRMVDQLERQRCLSNASTPYETYKKQSDQGDTKKEK